MEWKSLIHDGQETYLSKQRQWSTNDTKYVWKFEKITSFILNRKKVVNYDKQTIVLFRTVFGPLLNLPSDNKHFDKLK